MSTTPTMTGAFVRQPSTGSGKVYCIHGKPSGCCATLVSTEDGNSNHETPDPTDGKSSITICKYRTVYHKSLKRALHTTTVVSVLQVHIKHIEFTLSWSRLVLRQFKNWSESTYLWNLMLKTLSAVFVRVGFFTITQFLSDLCVYA